MAGARSTQIVTWVFLASYALMVVGGLVYAWWAGGLAPADGKAEANWNWPGVLLTVVATATMAILNGLDTEGVAREGLTGAYAQPGAGGAAAGLQRGARVV